MKTARSHPWWRLLVDGGAEAVEARRDGEDDPWADRAGVAPGLTPAQRAHLGALDDQPPVPRLSAADRDDDQ